MVKSKIVEPEYSDIYVRVRESRELSDYERGYTPLSDFASEKIHDAEKFVARMEKYLRDVGAVKS